MFLLGGQFTRELSRGQNNPTLLIWSILLLYLAKRKFPFTCFLISTSTSISPRCGYPQIPACGLDFLMWILQHCLQMTEAKRSDQRYETKLTKMRHAIVCYVWRPSVKFLAYSKLRCRLGPVKRKKFKRFVNTSERRTTNTNRNIEERGQQRPVNWSNTSAPLKLTVEPLKSWKINGHG